MSDNFIKNPYMNASDAYSATAAETDPRALEGTVLLKSAQKLEMLAERLKGGEDVHFSEVAEILTYNQKLWILFVDDAAKPEHPLPQEIKDNILKLGIFIFKRTIDMQIKPTYQGLQILISINRNIAAGLMKRTSAPAPERTPVQNAGKETADSFA